MNGFEESEPQDHLLVLAEKKYLLTHDPACDANAIIKDILQLVEEKGLCMRCDTYCACLSLIVIH